MNIRDLMLEEDELRVFPKASSNQQGSRILKLKRKDGTLFQAEIEGYPINLENQTLILGIVRDITKHKNQEFAIQQSESRALAYLKQTEELHHLVNNLNKANSLDEIISIAVDGIISVLKADRSSLLLFEEDGLAHFKAWHSLSAKYREIVDGHSPWEVDDLDAEPLCFETIPTDSLNAPINKALQEEGIGALLFVPLAQTDRLLGKFMVYFNSPHRFTEQELQLTQVIAQNLSAIISRLQLLEEMKQTTSELRQTVNALKQGEETIAELAEFNQSIVASAPIGIVTVNLDGEFTSANQAFLDMVGSPNSEETLKLSIDIPALKAVRFDQAVNHVVSTGEIIAINQLEYTSHWGKKISVNFKVVPQKQQNGRITGAIIVIDDVTADTEAKKLQTAVYQIAQAADQAKTLDDLIRNLHVIVQTVMFADNFYIALHDLPENAIIFPYYVDEKKEKTPYIRRPFSSGLTEYVLHFAKSLLVNKDQYIDLLARNEIVAFGAIPAVYLGVPLLVDGQPIGVMSVQHYQDPHAFGERERDMLEFVASQVAQTIDRKRKETALQKSEAQFRLLVENFREALVIIDRNLGKTVYANPSIYKIFGVSPEEVVDKGIETILADLIHPDDREYLQKASQQISLERKRGKNDTIELDFRIYRPDGEMRWLRQHSYPYMVDSSSSPSLIFMVLIDNTSRRLAEIDREESNQQLQIALSELKKTQENMVQRERLAAVGQLAAGIAHDFNNIMAVIVLYTEMSLRSDNLPKKLGRRLQTILSQAFRATELVQQILDFSRRAVLEPKPMQLIPFLNEQIKLLRRTLPENIRLHSNFEDKAFSIHADPTRIQQIVMNLIVNARDAMPDGGDLWLDVKLANVTELLNCAACPRPFSGNWVHLSVRDNGIGITPETISRIFEPFFTTKSAGAGSGLGLSQVAGIVDQHGGHLIVESEHGIGTTFSIFLPPVAFTSDVQHVEDTAVIPQGNRETLLIVEDDDAIREALADTVLQLNYQVVTAANGRQAFALLEKGEKKIDLVISDLIMPEMGGQALFHAIQQKGIVLPVILLSGYPLKGDLLKLQEQGIAGWLLKPPNFSKLAQLLSQSLAKPKRQTNR
ncbi:MAG: hypothetical protein DHS20C20_04500 [Ardenticatenaceae bacterium]|nr:MAG: hypothetical protein DHS20C20_04500 [Ardenticatenaceae bacterium]